MIYCAIEEAKTVCDSLDTKMESARSYGSAVGKAIMLAMDRVDGFDTQLDGLKEFRFKAVLDSKDIEAIKAEQKTLKEDYEQHLNKHKETLNQLRESEKSIVSNHRDELKEIMRGGERLAFFQGVGLGDYSFRAPVGCGWRRGLLLDEDEVHIMIIVVVFM